MTEYAPLTTAQKKKILGLNAAKMYGLDVPAELRLPDADEPETGPRGADDTAERAQDPTGRRGVDDGTRPARDRARRRVRAAAYDALSAVIDPELDEPITDLGFVRSLEVAGDAVTVHLRLPTSFCAPNFAYLMASDAKDALAALPWTRDVVVELDDHHDSDLINAGLAADAGYRGTFRHEAEQDLDELRATFLRKAHTAAMERCLTALLRAEPDRAVEDLGSVRLGDLPVDDRTAALLRRRAALGLPDDARRHCARRPRGQGVCRGRRAAGAAAGALDPHLHRRQRALLPRVVAHPLPGV